MHYGGSLVPKPIPSFSKVARWESEGLWKKERKEADSEEQSDAKPRLRQRHIL